MKWRQIGPFRGGRALAVEGVPGEPNTYYFGAVAGGVWKTTDGGANWAPLFQHAAVSSIGALAVAPSDHNVLYVGTGEAAIRGDISYGDGVYKSLDAGKTWRNVGLKDTRQIGALIVHPQDPDTVFVAALGHAFGPNAERGIFRTTDGGKSWQKVLGKDDDTGGIDVVFDPHNPNILFAALWQTRRQPWYFSSGGPGSGLYRSGDGGTTWKRLEGNGLPEGILGKIGVSVSGASGNRIYATIEAKEGGIFRSDDGGEHWLRVNEDGRFRQRAWYFSKIYADPKAVDTLYVLNTGLFRSSDGGKSFELLPGHPRRPPRALDRPAKRGPAHQCQRWRSQRFDRRRPYLDHPGQSAHGPVLPCRGGQRLPLSHLRRAAGQQQPGHRQPHRRRGSSGVRIGTKRAVASAASCCPNRAIGTSFIPTARDSSTATTNGRNSRRTSAFGQSTTPATARGI